jgi:hypothetical protein
VTKKCKAYAHFLVYWKFTQSLPLIKQHAPRKLKPIFVRHTQKEVLSYSQCCFYPGCQRHIGTDRKNSASHCKFQKWFTVYRPALPPYIFMQGKANKGHATCLSCGWQCCGSGSRIRDLVLFDHGIWDRFFPKPGAWMNPKSGSRILDPRSWIPDLGSRETTHISESLVTIS